LNKYIGYEAAAKVAKQALAENKTIRQVVVENGYVADGALTEAQLDEALDVLAMTKPALCVSTNPRAASATTRCTASRSEQRRNRDPT